MRILHLSSGQVGCKNELTAVMARLEYEVIHLDFHPSGLDDNNFRYNPTEEIAARFYEENKELILSCDAAITSDTVPMSRVLWGDRFPRKKIFWICNRFDYAHNVSNMQAYDSTYYSGLIEELQSPTTHLVPYNEFERDHYERRTGQKCISPVIRPTGIGSLGSSEKYPTDSPIPASVDRSKTIFIPPYVNESKKWGDLLKREIERAGFEWYSGRFAGPSDLQGFLAVTCFPYACSIFQLFEQLALGLPIIIPSKKLYREIVGHPEYWLHDKGAVLADFERFMEHYQDWSYETDATIKYDSFKGLPDILASKLQNREWHSSEALKLSASRINDSLMQWQRYLTNE